MAATVIVTPVPDSSLKTAVLLNSCAGSLAIPLWKETVTGTRPVVESAALVAILTTVSSPYEPEDFALNLQSSAGVPALSLKSKLDLVPAFVVIT